LVKGIVVRGKNVLEKAQRFLRYIVLRLVRVNDSAPRVAAGFSLGVFLGVFPTFGIAIPISFVLATLFRFNRASAVVGSLIMNPLTTPLFWSASATVGGIIFSEDTRKIMDMWEKGEKLYTFSKATLIYLSGNLIVSTIMALAGYFFALKAVRAYRKRKGLKSR
jgi:uncharacterized protein (DUF2062 family)